MNTLELTNLNLGPLTRCHGGYYYELLIQNCTTETIVVIDHENNKTPIKPVSMTPLSAECVIVLWRKSVEPTTNFTNDAKQISGYQIRIPKHVLLGEGAIFLKSINIVVCSEQGSIMASHPNVAADYDTALSEIRRTLADTAKSIPTISLMANDPKNRFTKLYTVVKDMPIDIPVTNILGEAKLKIIFSFDGRSSEYDIDIEEFLSSTKNVMELDDCPIPFITTNKAVAERSSGEYKKISQSEANRLLDAQKDKFNRERELLEQKHATEMGVKNQEIDVLKSQLRVATSEYDRIKSEYDSFTGNVSARMKIGENELKRDKAISSASEEKWKTIGVYGGLALGALTLILKVVQLGSKVGIV